VTRRTETLTRQGDSMTVGAFELTRTALLVHGDPSFDEWARIGEFIRLVNSGAQWWWGDWLNYGEGAYPERFSQAQEATGWEPGTLYTYSWVARSVPASNRLEAVPFGHYQNGLAALPPEEQAEWAEKVRAEKWSRGELRTALRLKKRAAAFEAGGLPEGKFRVIYADPPWAYDDSGVITTTDAYGRAERHYSTMSLDDLIALPVQDVAADDAVLWLWTTAPLLLMTPGPRDVVDAWGFRYKAGMVWDKVDHNYGHYVSVRHEHLLICTRGSCTPDAPTPMPDSVYAERPRAHSQKPDYFRTLIDQLYPFGEALELFARDVPTGRWKAWGNQTAVATV
jgi:N6-adenosine-specific RNA methylase IME4